VSDAADDPSYKGCRVRSFTCRGSADLLNAQGCVAGRVEIDFREQDIPLG
jgi:hypothetical protein